MRTITRSAVTLMVTIMFTLAGLSSAHADPVSDACTQPDPLEKSQCENAYLRGFNDTLLGQIQSQNMAMTALRLDYERIKPAADALPGVQLENVLLRNEVATSNNRVNALRAELSYQHRRVARLKHTVKDLRAIIRELRS